MSDELYLVKINLADSVDVLAKAERGKSESENSECLNESNL